MLGQFGKSPSVRYTISTFVVRVDAGGAVGCSVTIQEALR